MLRVRLFLLHGVFLAFAVLLLAAAPDPTGFPTAEEIADYAARQRPKRDGRVRVGFWNIRDFTGRRRDPRDLEVIATIAHQMDVLGIAEIESPTAIHGLVKMLERLGGDWDYVQTDEEVGDSPGSREHYAYVYRSDRLKIRIPPWVMPEVNFLVGLDAHSFDREPYLCGFETRDGGFDFTMLIVHVTYGHLASIRNAEVAQLRHYFELARDADPGDDDVILAGDFNRDAPSRQRGAVGNLLDSIPHSFDVVPDRSVRTVLEGDSTYDHMIFQRNHMREFTGLCEIEAFDVDLFDGVWEIAQRISDHRPIWAEFSSLGRDDD